MKRKNQAKDLPLLLPLAKFKADLLKMIKGWFHGDLKKNTDDLHFNDSINC